MGEARGASGVAAIGNRIYVAGGLGGRGFVRKYAAEHPAKPKAKKPAPKKKAPKKKAPKKKAKAEEPAPAPAAETVQ